MRLRYRCFPSRDLALIIELQTVPLSVGSAVTRAWCKVDLFNDAGALLAGRWKVSLRIPPIDLLGSSTRIAPYEKVRRRNISLFVVGVSNTMSSA
jgi:hypothetical protein